MTPDDAKYKFDFTTGGIDFSAGLYELDPVKYPEILTPILYMGSGSSLEIAKQYDTLWTDIQEDLGPEYLAGTMVKAFNIEITKITGGELTFNEKIAAIFQFRMVLVDGLLAITPE